MRWFILNSDTKWREITFFGVGGWEGRGSAHACEHINKVVKSEAVSFNVAAEKLYNGIRRAVCSQLNIGKMRVRKGGRPILRRV